MRTSRSTRRWPLFLSPLILLGLVSTTETLAAVVTSVSAELISVDAECRQPRYRISVSGVASGDDSGSGHDHVSIVVYDAAMHVVDVDHVDFFLTFEPRLQTRSIDMEYGNLEGEITALPLTVRVLDTTTVSEFEFSHLVEAVQSPLLMKTTIDPAAAAVACDQVTRGPEIHIRGKATTTLLAPFSHDPTIVESMFVLTPEPARLAISYSAECAVAGSEHAWVGITISVDGVRVRPTGPGNALCSGRGAGSLDHRISARTMGVVEVGAGYHRIDTIADLGSTRPLFPGDRWLLDDRSLSIIVPEPGVGSMLACGFGLLAFVSTRRNRIRKPRGLRAAPLVVMLLATALSSSIADAQLVIEHGLGSTHEYFDSTTPRQLRIDGAETFIALFAEHSSRLQIAFRAECTTRTSDTTTSMAIEIQVDGLRVSPTGVDLDFCTADEDGDGSWRGWVSAATTVNADIGPGVHFVTVRGHMFGGGEAQLDDMTVTILQTRRPTFP